MNTLNKEFDAWWKLGKYKKRDIPARDLHGHEEIRTVIPDSTCKDWPGPEDDIKFFVRTWEDTYVGFREPRTDTGRRARYCEFPVWKAA